MEYSPGHDGVVIEELPTIMGWIRSDDPDRTFASIQLRDDLLALRVPLDMPVVDRSTWYYHTYVVRDYHISADGLSSIDPRGCYEIFYSQSESHIGYHSEEFDYWFEKLLYATTMEEAFEACLMCQWIIARDVASIPTCALWGYWAHRTNYGTHAGEEVYEGLKWEGFVNELGASFPSFWTYLNVHPQGFAKGGTLRQGLLVDIEKFNPVHAEWFYDWLILQQIYEPLITNHPYDVTEKIPWLCSNWTAGTWELEGENCTRLRFKLLPSILWHDETPVTLDDVGFSFTYMKDEASIANYWAVQNFYGYLTADNASNPDWDPLPGPGEIDILYDVESWHALEWAAGVPIIPKHIWEGQDSWTWNPEDHGAVIGSGPFMAVGGEGPHEGEVGWPDWTPEYVHLVANPLYHRRYVWPDATNAAHDVMARDNVVTRADYDMVRWPDHKDTYDPRLYPLLPAWDTSWMNATTGDHYLDVDKNGAIDVDDLLEISVRYGQEWPPCARVYISNICLVLCTHAFTRHVTRVTRRH
jgi:ABC-type transport system substrate-binding protein